MSKVVSNAVRKRIDENWKSVCDDVSQAAVKAGRSTESVMIVGVSKYVGPELTEALFDAGCKHLGENRPQLLWEKAEALSSCEVSWHMIGNLQRNKAKRTIPLVHMLHSVDSVRLAKGVADVVVGGKHCDCLLEANVSGDAEKHGFDPDEIESALAEIALLPQLRVRGLMCMAAFGSSPDEARKDFSALRELRDRLKTQVPEGVILDELSMGMSSDFAEAIAEGATIVRIGSRLFDGVR